jgi:hypothetical protein
MMKVLRCLGNDQLLLNLSVLCEALSVLRGKKTNHYGHEAFHKVHYGKFSSPDFVVKCSLDNF